MTRIVRYILAGMLGALIAWMIMEPTALLPDQQERIGYATSFLIGMLSGFFPGLLIGIADAFSGLSPRDAVKRVLIGAAVGAGGGAIGISFGNAIFSAAQVAAYGSISLFSFILILLGRSSGWALLGAFIGLSQGLATSSTKRMINGSIGGVLGGGFGGFVFQILVEMNTGGAVGFSPAMIRFISFAVTGAGIGFFIGLIEEVTKNAWLVRLVGRNEGKEYLLYKPVTVLGRSEYVDIPIYTDADVIERHAQILSQGQRHTIEDLGSSSGTQVNGQKISKQVLADSDIIVIGKTRFMYRDKATTGFGGRQDSDSYSGVKLPQSEHICQFCGAIKDANGNCECTISPQAPVAPQPNVPQGQQIIHNNTPPTVRPAPPEQTNVAAVQQEQQSGGASLACVGGPLAGQIFPLKQGETQIGRDSTKAIPLSMDNTVSRNHARIDFTMGGYVLYDSGSTNGTYVNGQKIIRHDLKPGDIVQIGSNKFKFEA